MGDPSPCSSGASPNRMATLVPPAAVVDWLWGSIPSVRWIVRDGTVGRVVRMAQRFKTTTRRRETIHLHQPVAKDIGSLGFFWRYFLKVVRGGGMLYK